MYTEIMNYAQSQLINVESLAELENSFDGMTGVEIEMGTDFYTNDTLQAVIEYVVDEYDVNNLEAFKAMFNDDFKLLLYYAEQDNQFVAAFN